MRAWHSEKGPRTELERGREALRVATKKKLEGVRTEIASAVRDIATALASTE